MQAFSLVHGFPFKSLGVGRQGRSRVIGEGGHHPKAGLNHSAPKDGAPFVFFHKPDAALLSDGRGTCIPCEHLAFVSFDPELDTLAVRLSHL